jgi:hypothetical protein
VLVTFCVLGEPLLVRKSAKHAANHTPGPKIGGILSRW